jgi:hypothetical protein
MDFGIYLVQQEVVSAEQYIEAAARQSQDRVSLGQLAMESGELTKIHVLHILSIQAKSQKLFGQIAIDLGYLEKQQVAELLLRQDQRLKPIGEILVSMGALTQVDLDSQLKDYRQQMADKMDPSGVLRTVV